MNVRWESTVLHVPKIRKNYSIRKCRVISNICKGLVHTISDVDSWEIIWNFSFNVDDQKGFFQLIYWSKVTLQIIWHYWDMLYIFSLITCLYMGMMPKMRGVVRTWDGSNGWSTNSNTESTKASNIFTERSWWFWKHQFAVELVADLSRLAAYENISYQMKGFIYPMQMLHEIQYLSNGWDEKLKSLTFHSHNSICLYFLSDRMAVDRNPYLNIVARINELKS